MTGLSIWRVELLRVVRTRRLLALLSLYAFLGISGPLVAAYAQEIFTHLSTSATIQVTVAAPRPADGVLGYHRSAMQLGLVACIVVTGLALSLDARPALSVFYRSRARVERLLLPRLAVSASVACAAYTFGLLLAWYETATLIGSPGFGPVAVTWGLGMAYTAFAVALTLMCSALFRSTLGAVGAAVVVVLALPLLGQLPRVATYLPSRLVTVPDDVFRHLPGVSATASLLVTAAVAVVGTAAAVAAIARRR